MKVWHEVKEGRWSLLPPNYGKMTLEFENGWLASVIAQGHGLSSCVARPADVGRTQTCIGPQEAFDSEVALWLARVSTWEPPK